MLLPRLVNIFDQQDCVSHSLPCSFVYIRRRIRNMSTDVMMAVSGQRDIYAHRPQCNPQTSPRIFQKKNSNISSSLSETPNIILLCWSICPKASPEVHSKNRTFSVYGITVFPTRGQKARSFLGCSESSVGYIPALIPRMKLSTHSPVGMSSGLFRYSFFCLFFYFIRCFLLIERIFRSTLLSDIYVYIPTPATDEYTIVYAPGIS